ncbi:MAG TPA: ester cyclase, partial [Roseiflexaceae bacterium]|nr:ester cyclase [Roseiflexaceae bacterium]
WNQRRLDVAAELVDPAYTSHFPVPGQPPGIDGFRYAVDMLHTSFPDLSITVEDLIAEGDKVVARLRAQGTHQAPFRGIAATGREVSWTGIRIFRLANGKIVEHWANWDDLSLVQQLGARIEV